MALWPTPTARDWKGQGFDGQLPNAVALWSEAQYEQAIGTLNPTWVEWLMGFPPGWTDLGPSETPSSPRSPSTSADS